MINRVTGVCLLSLLTVSATIIWSPGAHADQAATKTPIKHLLFLLQENHTFDSYFGTYPGADGLPKDVCMPVNADNCIKPFHLGSRAIQDLDHSEETFSAQFNNGKMDGFVTALDAKGQPGRQSMGYYDDREIPFYWNVADNYVLFDHFFSSDAAGSVPNHIYWVSATKGIEKNVIPVSGIDVPTIFDRLQAKGISWKFYVQNYDPTINFRTAPERGERGAQAVFVPILNFPRYVDDPSLASHIVDLDQYYDDVASGSLPAVAFMAPSGASEHPPGSVRAGEYFVANLVNALMLSRSWDDSAFIWAYDDWGGWYDHIPPPQVDKDGYGFRVPALLVSPYAQKGRIEHTQLDFTSVLRFIEGNWGLEPLASRDASARSIEGVFDFDLHRPPVILGVQRSKTTRKQPSPESVFGPYGVGLILVALSLALGRKDRGS